MGVQLDTPSPAHHFSEPVVSETAHLLYGNMARDHRLARMPLDGLCGYINVNADKAFATRAEHGKSAMRWCGSEWFTVFEVVFELSCLLRLASFGIFACDQAATDLCLGHHKVPQITDQFGIFAKALHQNIFSAV